MVTARRSMKIVHFETRADIPMAAIAAKNELIAMCNV